MPRYTIVHLTPPQSVIETGRFSDENDAAAYADASFGTPAAAAARGFYKADAVVAAANPEALFTSTQNIDAPWTGITPLLKGEDAQRSTSVGDFIVDEAGDVMFCASCGWDPVTGETAAQIRELAQAFAA